MGVAAEYFYYPIPANWWHASHWRRKILRSPREVPIALEGYRRILTPEAVYSQNWMHHPLVADYVFIRNRWRMLETGAVIARLPKLADYPGRLLVAKSHLQTVAELRAALLLQRMGFRVRRDPANDHTTAQKRKKGVDWLASADVRLGFLDDERPELGLIRPPVTCWARVK